MESTTQHKLQVAGLVLTVIGIAGAIATSESFGINTKNAFKVSIGITAFGAVLLAYPQF